MGFQSPESWMRLVGDGGGWGGGAPCIGMTSAKEAEEVGLTRIFYPESPGIDGYGYKKKGVLHLNHI